MIYFRSIFCATCWLNFFRTGQVQPESSGNGSNRSLNGFACVCAAEENADGE